MATVKINLSQKTINDMSTVSDGAPLTLDLMLQTAITANSELSAAYYYASKYTTTSNSVKFTYGDGTTSTIVGASQVSGYYSYVTDPLTGNQYYFDQYGTAVATSKVLNIPGGFSEKITGTLYYYWGISGGYLSYRSDVSVIDKYELVIPSDQDFGKITYTVNGSVGIGFNSSGQYSPGTVSGQVSSFQLKATKLLKQFDVAGNFGLSGTTDNPVISGTATSLKQVFTDNSLLEFSGSLTLSGAQSIGDSLAGDASLWSGNDDFNISLPSQLVEDMNIRTGSGNDTITAKGGGGRLFIDAGENDDEITLLDASPVINGGDGDDTVKSSVISLDLGNYTSIENITLLGTKTLNATGNNDVNVLVGNAAANVLDGKGGADTLDGGADNDTLTGGAGNDVYYVDAAGDVIIEAASDNTPEQEKFSMGNNNDVVIASTNYVLTANAAVEDVMAKGTLTGSTTNANINLTANDLGQGLIGNEGKNTLTGKNGEDVLVGMGGDDILNGGDGFDILIGGAGKDTLNGGAGNDVFLFNIGSAEGTDFVGNSGSISLTGGTDTIDGGDGEDDTIILTGTLSDYTLSKTSATEYRIVANQMLLGATSVETATFKNIENLGFINTIDDLENDNVTVVSLSSIPIASPFADILNAPSDLDWSINGLAGNDSITGGAGNDTLDGGADNDTLTGGAGNDVYYVDAAGDVIIEAASDNTPEQEKFSMGNNNDVVIASTNYVLTANAAVEDVMAKGTLTGSTTNANINLTANDLGQGLIGNEGKNTLTGKNGEDVLVGMGGDDILNGGDGFDILIGGAGKDTLNGGAGNDVFLFNIGSAEGTDFVGNSGSISLTGGTDTIDGGDGEDDTIILTGTLSDYTLSKTSATEYRIVANQMLLGATSVETATFKNIENLGFINTIDDLENDNVTVVSLSSIPIASPFADILNAPSDLDWSINGLAGNDSITGGAGNDTLDGGADNDTLTGGAGNDVYYVDAAGDVIIEAASDNTPEQEKFSMGNNNDVVIASTNYVLTANAAVEDVMAKGTLTGSTTNANINLTANDLGQGLIGNEGKNTLTGKNGEDVLVGMGGDDILNGGDGFDILIGGAGKDTLNGGAGNDVFLFNIGSAEGTDFVGNSGSISLTGGTDTIDGGDGEDDTIILTGTLSDYTLSKTSATEYRIVANQMLLGATSVETATFKNIENLGFINTIDDLENDNVTVVSLSSIPIASPFADILNAPSDLDWSINGLAGNDSITGGAGNDTLDGGADNDTLTGGAGNDVYYVDAAGDVIIEAASDNTPEQEKFSMGNNNDVVIASTNYVLTANAAVEDVMAKGTLTGSTTNANINLTANDLGQGLIGNEGKNTLTGKNGEDVLVGMGGDDILNGGDGFDILIGGAGKDTLNGGAGADWFFFDTLLNAKTNIDRITDFVTGIDRILLHDGIFNMGTTGQIAEGNFVKGSTGVKALDSNDHLIFNTTTGALFYDADGNGSGAAIQFATLTGVGNNVAYTDFWIV